MSGSLSTFARIHVEKFLDFLKREAGQSGLPDEQQAPNVTVTVVANAFGPSRLSSPRRL